MKAASACSLAMLAATLKQTDGFSVAALMLQATWWRRGKAGEICVWRHRGTYYPSVLQGKMQGLCLSNGGSDFPVCSNDMWCLKLGLKNNHICHALINKSDVLEAKVGCKMAEKNEFLLPPLVVIFSAVFFLLLLLLVLKFFVLNVQK